MLSPNIQTEYSERVSDGGDFPQGNHDPGKGKTQEVGGMVSSMKVT